MFYLIASAIVDGARIALMKPEQEHSEAYKEQREYEESVQHEQAAVDCILQSLPEVGISNESESDMRVPLCTVCLFPADMCAEADLPACDIDTLTTTFGPLGEHYV